MSHNIAELEGKEVNMCGLHSNPQPSTPSLLSIPAYQLTSILYMYRYIPVYRNTIYTGIPVNTSIPDNWVCSPTHTWWDKKASLPLLAGRQVEQEEQMRSRRREKIGGTGNAWNGTGTHGKSGQERNDWHSWGRGIDAPWLTHSLKHHQLWGDKQKREYPGDFSWNILL